MAIPIGRTLFGDGIDFGIGFVTAEYHVAKSGFAKLTGEVDVLPMVERLIAKEYDLPLKQRCLDVGNLIGGQRLG